MLIIAIARRDKMGLLLFAVLFALINLGLWIWAKSQLNNYECRNIVAYIRGTVRGYFGRIDSNVALERKRACLNKKNSKF